MAQHNPIFFVLFLNAFIHFFQLYKRSNGQHYTYRTHEKKNAASVRGGDCIRKTSGTDNFGIIIGIVSASVLVIGIIVWILFITVRNKHREIVKNLKIKYKYNTLEKKKLNRIAI